MVKPGDKIPLKGVAITVLTSNGEGDREIAGRQRLPIRCARMRAEAARHTENQRSAGILLTYGKFKFLDLGDLTWDKEMELACPVNKMGTVTLVSGDAPRVLRRLFRRAGAGVGLKPQVVVVNNGARKGLATECVRDHRQDSGHRRHLAVASLAWPMTMRTTHPSR